MSLCTSPPLRLAGAVGAAALLLAGCASPAGGIPSGGIPSGDPGSGPAAEAVPHGYVAGAQEAAEPQTRLTAVSAAGEVSVTDPATETVTRIGSFPGISAASGTDRYVFLANEEDGTVRIVDSGGWTVPHGDHRHYYSTEPRLVGSITGERPGRIVSSEGHTAVFFGDGTVTTLDHEDLAAGDVAGTSFSAAPHQGVAVPFAGSFLVSVAGDGQGSDAAPGTAVELSSSDGVRSSIPGAGCAELEGYAVTRAGVVFGCADGALLITGDRQAGITARHLPYPAQGTGLPAGTDRARSFDHRTGSAEVAAVAGTAGAWHLDLNTLTWQLLAAGEPLAGAAAAGDGAHVLAVGRSGSLISLDTAAAAVKTSRPLSAGPLAPDAEPVLEINPERAYIVDEAAGTVLEIDYADDLRTARTLDAGLPVRLLVETGR